MRTSSLALPMLVALVLAACGMTQSPTPPASSSLIASLPGAVTPADLVAWDARAMELVVQQKFPPTTASQLYAALAMGQYRVLAEGRAAIDEVGDGVLCRFTPECVPTTPSASTSAFFADLDARRATMQSAPAPEMPDRAHVWKGNGTPPVTPNAGEWPLWITSDLSNALPPPPDAESMEDQLQLDAVRDATTKITDAQRAAVEFWAGSPGTVTPGGLWLQELDAAITTSTDLRTAALDRATMTAAVADAFVTCWKAKFVYWTERPTERDPSIITVIPVPNFPSYPSGHATISAAAATVLIGTTGDQRYDAKSQEAADSRVWAGIHFPVDATGGQAVGKAIGQQALAWRLKELGS